MTGDVPVPPGWVRAGGFNGVPLWRWRDGNAATRDMDQLLFIGAMLDEMGAEELRDSVARFLR